MKYQIVKTITNERVYEVEADSAQEALEKVDDNQNLFDDEETTEKTTVNGEEWYDY